MREEGPCDFENAQQAHTAERREAEGGARIDGLPHDLEAASQHNLGRHIRSEARRHRIEMTSGAKSESERAEVASKGKRARIHSLG